MLPKLFNSDIKILQKSRLIEKVESKKIISIIEELRLKEQELKKSSEELSPDSLDYSKHAILSGFLKNIDRSIAEFNHKASSDDFVVETQDFINLLRELAEHIKVINQNPNYKETLSQFRNHDRDRIRNILNVGVWGAIGAAFAFSTFGVGASAFLLGSGVEKFVESKTNLNNPLPRTCVLLNDLLKTLDLTIKNLILAINIKQVDYDKVHLSDEDNMICPITKELMEFPVVFVLDGYSYEKVALTKWLMLKGSSPLIPKNKMKDTDKVEDMMVPNRQLKFLIDNYKLYKQKTELEQEIVVTPKLSKM